MDKHYKQPYNRSGSHMIELHFANDSSLFSTSKIRNDEESDSDFLEGCIAAPLNLPQEDDG